MRFARLRGRICSVRNRVVVEVEEEASYTKISDLLCWHRSRSARMGLEGERWWRERAGGLLGP